VFQPKRVWGPKWWYTLHTYAIEYPDAVSSLSDQQRHYAEIMSIINNLPCGKCQRHALQHISANPPNMRGSAELQAWLFNFHNAVNIRLKKACFTIQEYQAKFADELRIAAHTKLAAGHYPSVSNHQYLGYNQ
jgi:hypothetical protein